MRGGASGGVGLVVCDAGSNGTLLEEAPGKEQVGGGVTWCCVSSHLLSNVTRHTADHC